MIMVGSQSAVPAGPRFACPDLYKRRGGAKAISEQITQGARDP